MRYTPTSRRVAVNRSTSCTSWPLTTYSPLPTCCGPSTSPHPMPTYGASGAVVAPGSVFTKRTIWQINIFDQWGVELGKSLANRIADELDPAAAPPAHHDGSTLAMIGRARAFHRQAGGSA